MRFFAVVAALRGQRLVAVDPHEHWETFHICRRLVNAGLTAPLVVHGAFNGDVLYACIEQVRGANA